MFGWFRVLIRETCRNRRRRRRSITRTIADGDTIEDCCRQIFQREAEADDVTREVLIAVWRTFVTPFDRPDIQDLITFSRGRITY